MAKKDKPAHDDNGLTLAGSQREAGEPQPIPPWEGLPVLGYKPQPNANVMAVNHNKQLEETLLRVLDGMKQNENIDQRWLQIGRTHIEEGFMAINRAIFKPGRAKLDSDDKQYGMDYANRDKLAEKQD